MSSSARSYRHTHTHPHTHTDTEYFPQLYSEADRIENLFNYPLKRFYQSHPQAAVFGSDFDSSLSSMQSYYTIHGVQKLACFYFTTALSVAN